MHKIGPIINHFAGWCEAMEQPISSHSSKNCMAYDEIADLILELTILLRLYKSLVRPQLYY